MSRTRAEEEERIGASGEGEDQEVLSRQEKVVGAGKYKK